MSIFCVSNFLGGGGLGFLQCGVLVKVFWPFESWYWGSMVESMWRLGLRGSESYPERPGVPNCVYYMRTGFCGYGGRCRYNHPRDRVAVNYYIFINYIHFNWFFGVVLMRFSMLCICVFYEHNLKWLVLLVNRVFRFSNFVWCSNSFMSFWMIFFFDR